MISPTYQPEGTDEIKAVICSCVMAVRHTLVAADRLAGGGSEREEDVVLEMSLNKWRALKS